tara:strand:+ start:991 stop:1320 length:330 start_codon:yes stop_codon:yes gene_type:complete
MAEVVYIQSPQPASTPMSESTLERFFRYFIYLTIIALLIGAIVAAYLVVDNWEWIVTTFTTGFLGWLNPFDSDKGDTGPVDTVVESVDEATGFSTALGLAWWWPPNWFS